MENLTKEDEVIVKTNFTHKINLNFPKEATVFDLKSQISKNFLIREDEYELFLGDKPILAANNKTSLSALTEEYHSTDFNIKSYKNIFDLKKQLVDYNEFLDKNIQQKEQEIKNFKNNLDQLINELKELDENSQLPELIQDQ